MRAHRSTLNSAIIWATLAGCGSGAATSSAPQLPSVTAPGVTGVTGATGAAGQRPASVQWARGREHESEPSGVHALEVPGFLPAMLVVPKGVDTRPLVVAAHGAGGGPEWECDYWTRLTLGRAFVLCLRGTRINPRAGFYFRTHHALDAELTAALAAARRHSPRIAPHSGIYAGFSQGASMGALVVAKHARELPYVVLIEGFQQWNVALGRAFAERGGQAVMFACGTRECASAAEASTHALERVGLRARADHAPGAGHTAGAEVAAGVAANMPWLVAGDAAWAILRR